MCPFTFLGIQDEQTGDLTTDDPLVLPDIKDMLKKKEMEEELERIEEEKKEDVKKIKRSDIAAFTKVGRWRLPSLPRGY